MKILLVNTHLDPRTGGGYLFRTLELARAFRAAGHDVVLAATDHEYGPEAEAETNGLTKVLFKCLWPRFFVPAAGAASIRKTLAGVDFVHLMGHWSLLNILFAREARRAGIPYAICPAGALPPVGRSSHLKSIFHRWLGSSAIASAKNVIAITQKEATQLRDFGIPSEKIRVVPNGIHREFFESVAPDAFRSSLQLGNAPYVLFVGRLNPIKGPDILLDAYVQAALADRNIHLVLVGPDEGLRAPLLEKARASGVEKFIHMPGFLNQLAKREAYAGCLFLAVPSRSEAMSLVALEAAANGKPVILTDQCGFDEVEKVGGGLVVPASSGPFADALSRVASATTEERAQMGARLRDFASQHYQWPSLVKDIIR